MGANIKILMTADTLGGVWNYTLDLCQALQAMDVEVHLATLGKIPDEHQMEEIDNIPNIVLYASEYKLEWMEDPWEEVNATQKWLIDISRELKPDIIHFSNFIKPYHDWGCPVITVFHSCVLSWWQAIHNTVATQSSERYKNHVATALSGSDVVVFPSASIMNTAEEIYGNFKGRVIYNGRSEPPAKIIQKQPIIFSSGRIWDKAKNMEILTHVAKDLSWPVYIAGNNKHPQTGEELKLENVHFLGQLRPDSVREWMQRAAIYVSPAKYEPFGLSILEAAQEKCVLAMSDIDSLRELWSDSACFFDPDNPEDLRLKLNKLIDNHYLRNYLVRKSVNRAENYNMQHLAENYLNMYCELLRPSALNILQITTIESL